MARINIPEKTLEKWAKEDLELHKRVLMTYLFSRNMKLKGRNKFFKLYNMLINEGNIYDYFYIPIHIFVSALVLDRLNQVRSYIQNHNPNREVTKPKRKRRKK